VVRLEVCLDIKEDWYGKEVKRLKELELENSWLRKAVSDLTLDKLILRTRLLGEKLGPHP
jgi:hypothetical protein